ncbi:MAG: hypothetical protein HYY30_03775 [Chloroflexi bacterium]|nr:hypothetical protein [Chloroflexota bacterium]
MSRSTSKQTSKAGRGGAQHRRPRSGGNRSRRWLALGLLFPLVAIVVMVYLMARPGGGGSIAVIQANDFHALAFSPDDADDANVVFFGHHNGVMRSDDGGRTWRSLVAQRNFDAMGLVVNPANPRHLYLAGHNIFFASVDGGTSWQSLTNNLPGGDIHGFTASPDALSRLFAFVVGHGLFASNDGGKQWEKLSEQLPGDVIDLAAGSSQVLFAGSVSGGVLRSVDGGKTWERSGAGLGGSNVTALAVESTNQQIVFAGTDSGLYRSDDAGASWRELTFPGQNVATLAISPSNPRVVLAIEFVRAGEGRVYRSEDGGTTWEGS